MQAPTKSQNSQQPDEGQSQPQSKPPQQSDVQQKQQQYDDPQPSLDSRQPLQASGNISLDFSPSSSSDSGDESEVYITDTIPRKVSALQHCTIELRILSVHVHVIMRTLTYHALYTGYHCL